MPVAWFNQHAIGSLDFQADNSSNLAWSIDPINAFNKFPLGIAHFHCSTRAVARIAEINPAVGIEGQLIWGIEFVALIAVGQNRDHAILFGTCDAAVARLASDQASFLVE